VRRPAPRASADKDAIGLGCVLDRFLFDLVAHLGDILAGARRGVASTQQRRGGAQERDQGEGQQRRSFEHGVTYDLGFGGRHGKGASARSSPDRGRVFCDAGAGLGESHAGGRW